MGQMREHEYAEQSATAFYRMTPEQRRPEYRNQTQAIVPAWRVVPELRQVVYSTLELAVYHLGLPPVQIRWFVPLRHAQPGERHKEMPLRRDAVVEPSEHPTEIFLSAWVKTPVWTVLHESRHLLQWQDGRMGAPTGAERWLTPEKEDELELDASVWADTTQRELRLAEYPPCAARGVVR